MEKITVEELKGRKIVDFRKENGKLILNIKDIGERVVACNKCGNVDFYPNTNFKECKCGNEFFVFLRE